MRVAQIGTFDLDNLGDLLFPYVFSRVIEGLAREKEGSSVEIVLFSPKGSRAGYFYKDQIESLPLHLFETEDSKKKFDRVFIGGGDIIRDDDWSLHSVYGEPCPDLTFSKILSPTISSSRRLVLLSPGAPFQLSGESRVFLRNSFSRLVSAAVRDAGTKEIIEDLCPAGTQLLVLPDIVNLISKCLPRFEASERAKNILSGAVLDSSKYICFQGHKDVVGDVRVARDFLRDIELKLGLPIVLLEIGRCLGDKEFLSSLSHECGYPLVSVCDQRPMDMLDKVAVIANSAGFIGSSLHGNIIAKAYGRPHISFVGAVSNKTKGFFSQNKTGLLFNSFAEVVKDSHAVTSFLMSTQNGNLTDAGEGELENYIRSCLFLSNHQERESKFSKDVDDLFKGLHKNTINAVKKLKHANENSCAQILYRDDLVAQLQDQLAGEKENARSQIVYRDDLVAQLQDQLAAEKENARSQILYRDGLVAQLQGQIAKAPRSLFSRFCIRLKKFRGYF